MRIGLSLPTVFPADHGELVMEWARRADKAGFTTLTTLDRIVYDNFEPIVTLTAAAAVTERIRLMTAILLVPVRNAGVVAKQIATLDVVSKGRVTLGIGVGNRTDDFVVNGLDPHTRGKRLDAQLALMRRAWAGEDSTSETGRVGPLPVQQGGPPLIFGGGSDAAVRRIVEMGEGWVTGTVTDPDRAKQTYDRVAAAWSEAGKPGKPLFVGSLACAVGEAEAKATDEAGVRYYARSAQPSADNIPSTAEAIREALKACEAAGMDEVFVRPAGVTDPDQVDRLAEAVL